MVRLKTGVLALVVLGLLAGAASADTPTKTPKERVYLSLSGLG